MFPKTEIMDLEIGTVSNILYSLVIILSFLQQNDASIQAYHSLETRFYALKTSCL